ncbi:multiple C2 and transmembrane domain-containing protein 1-like [Amphiura filiformis]|uniref:multiple C2 and transmembrane domain-containing protein 1-like n=1 Tax=Amphiura filiformis TaxID=82378 RepID=UPI003B215AF4
MDRIRQGAAASMQAHRSPSPKRPLPSGISGNDDDLSADSSTPGLGKDDPKKHGFWRNLKKKTNPVKQFQTLRDKQKRKKGGSETPSPIHQCYSEDSDGGRRDSEEWSREDCFSDTDIIAIKNGSLKKRHRTRKNKSLSFEDERNKQTLNVPRKSSNIEQYKHSPASIRKRFQESQDVAVDQESPERRIPSPDQAASPARSNDSYGGHSSDAAQSSGAAAASGWNSSMDAGSSFDAAEDTPGDVLSEADESIRALQDTVRWQGLQEESAFFQLDIHLKEGRDLAIRDRSGTSDPYVKFKVSGKQLYKSRTIYKNLNPKWDERITLCIDDISKPLEIFVLDYDRGPKSDDAMGQALVNLMGLEPNTPCERRIALMEDACSEYLGYLILGFTVTPRKEEEREQFSSKRRRQSEPISMSGSQKGIKLQLWSGVVTMTLLEGKNLIPMDDNGLSDPYVKFKLGNEKYKSRVEPKTLNPKWMEQFDLHLYDDLASGLEISVWDKDVGSKDDIMGRASIDLATLKREETHVLDIELEDGAGMLFLLLTISGTKGGESISDLANFKPDPNVTRMLHRRYNLANSFKYIKDTGWLQIKVVKAQNLASADFGGKSDPFCVLELVNSRLQTQTMYKTLNPEWGKVFTFNIKDIHSVLEVTVFDEDKHGSPEFLGKIAIPIQKIKNGERKYYALKDKKLRRRAKGAILLEMEVIWNNVRAAVRTFNPREQKYMDQEQKFKISVLQYNLTRVTGLVSAMVDTGKFINSCFQWESKSRSLIAFLAYLLIVWNFELYMVPIAILLIFLWKYVEVCITEKFRKPVEEDDYVESEDEDDDKDEEKEGSKRSFKEKLHTIERVCQTIQNTLDEVACFGERVKNTFNFTVPWLSWLAVIVLCIATCVLYLVPLRVLILAWGINKFTKKLRAPHAINNNELLDFLSRMPSDNQIKQYSELRPENLRSDSPKKKK